MRLGHKFTLLGIAALFLLVCIVFAQENSFDEDDEEIFFKSVRDRKLVSVAPSFRSILKEHMNPGTETKTRAFNGPTLGYVTPWYVDSFAQVCLARYVLLTEFSATTGTQRDTL